MISIIIPTYNSGETLRQTLESILIQGYPRLEILLIDGVSTDNTLEIINEYLKNYSNIYLYSEKDENVYDAMNKGIVKATGDYLYFMGSDDVFFETNTLNKIAAHFQNNDLIYGNVIFKNSREIFSGESSLKKLTLNQVGICHQAIFYSKSIFEKIGIYNLRFFIHADYDFNIRCFQDNTIKKIYLPIVVAIFNELGLSGKQSNADGFHTELTKNYLLKDFSILELYRSKEALENEILLLRNSKAYKIGIYLIKPIKYFLKLIH